MRAVFMFWALLVLLVSGCQHPPGSERSHSKSAAPPAVNAEIRNNSASLLYDLLREEKHLPKLLIVKRDTDELNRLIKAIATEAEKGVASLEQFAKADASFNLQSASLPAGEKVVREVMGKRKARELLKAKGNDFEFRLLLTQVEALNYAAHLAGVAAEAEPDVARARQFTAISEGAIRLHAQVLQLLRARAASLQEKPPNSK